MGNNFKTETIVTLLNVYKRLLHLCLPIITFSLPWVEFEGKNHFKGDVMGLRNGCLILQFTLITVVIDVFALCNFEAKLLGYILHPSFKNLFFNAKRLFGYL